jgi:hypothetical protein
MRESTQIWDSKIRQGVDIHVLCDRALLQHVVSQAF